MGRFQARHLACFLLLVSSFALSAAAAGPPATNGTSDPAVLSTIPALQDLGDLPDPALEVPGPARGRYRRDGTLVAVMASIPRTMDSAGPRPASVMTADRLDNNVCMVVQSTGPDRACKVSPNGRFRFCLQRGEWG